jgi:ferredoxin-thioredoxin reductase catalytic subunit
MTDDVDTCAECGHPVDEHAEHYGCWQCPCPLNPGPYDPNEDR